MASKGMVKISIKSGTPETLKRACNESDDGCDTFDVAFTLACVLEMFTKGNPREVVDILLMAVDTTRDSECIEAEPMGVEKEREPQRGEALVAIQKYVRLLRK